MPGELSAGTHLAGYRIERLLGEGATGAVYLAHDEQLDRRVALKLLPRELSRDERFRRRFLREARMAAGLEHPGIVTIYAAGEADGLLYLAMRHVRGSDLRSLLERDGRLDLDRALSILRPVAEALDAAHSRGLVHRDVKPGNILVDDDGRAFLADFGLAKHAATVNSLSREGVFSGTIDYVAPEQIQGGEVDGRADVYALACVLFELLTGRPPFERETDLAVVFAHLKESPPPVSALRPELPAALDDVLARGLAKDPEDRYQTASELVSAARSTEGGGGESADIPAKPTQLRTFLIADVRGYTRYTQQHGDEAAAELATAFADAVKAVVAARDGRLIELRGDEALVVFDSARQALLAALAIQAAVGERGLAHGVGIGVDAGEAVPVGKGYRGGALNMAARLCSLAGPGEVLASEAVVHLARAVTGVRYLQGRMERLKGIAQPVRVVEVVPQESSVALVRAVTRRLRGRRWPIAVAGAVALVIAGAAIVATRGGREPALSALRTVAAFTPDGKLDASVPTGVDTFDEKYLDGFVWSLNDGGTLLKIDPRKEEAVQAVSIGPDAGWTVGGGAVWVADANEPQVLRVDAQYGSTSRIGLPKGPEGSNRNPIAVAFGSGSLWVSQGPRILRLDPATGKVRAAIPSNDAHLLTFGDGALYAATQYTGDFFKVDPASNTVQWRSHLHPWLPDIEAAAGWLWVTVDSDAGVYRFSEADGSQSGFVHTGDGSGALTFGGGSIWVGNWRAGTISRVDPVSSAVKTFPTGNAPNGLTVTPDGRVWVGIAARPPDYAATVKGDVARFVLREDWLGDQNDPATAWSRRPFELEYATEAKLYNYPDWRGPDPSRPVPEIASEFPRVAHGDGVWTYTIPIRGTYRFSPPSNAPVTAESMRYTIERALSPELGDFQPASLFLKELVGEDAYRSGKSAHISGLVAHGSALVFRTTAPVPDLVDRLALPFFSAVPTGTPVTDFDPQRHPIPTAGPYHISYQNIGWQTVLRRNPNYHGPRPHRLDAVVYVVGIDTGPAAARIERGELDYLAEEYPDFGALQPGGDIARRYAGSNPGGSAGRPLYTHLRTPGLRWLAFNTRHGPLADIDARRAINAVIDRRALAAVDGGIPSDQYLPPSLMGAAANRHQYPLDVPDIARARRLWAGRADRLELRTCKTPQCTQQANILRQDLAQLGVRLVVRAVSDQYTPPVGGADMRLENWYLDEYDPGNMLGPPDAPETVLFSEDSIVNPFGNRSDRLARKAAAAAKLSGGARREAFSRLAQEALRTWVPWAVFEQVGQPAFFSARLGCITSVPAYAGVDIGRICIRTE